MKSPSKPSGSPTKINCWEFNQCGYGPPADAAPGSGGVCPAAGSRKLDGINGGRGAGRICWMMPGTFCQGIPTGTVTSKLGSCCDCSFFKLVKAEEGEKFIRVSLGEDRSS